MAEQDSADDGEFINIMLNCIISEVFVVVVSVVVGEPNSPVG